MRVLCVCGTGQGSSLVLRMTVEEILREHGIEADVEHTDPTCASGDNCDYILTSEEIAGSINNPGATILTVTNYINKKIVSEEISRLLEERR